MRVLHLGCGTSTLCETLEDLNANVVHLDRNPQALRIVEERIPHKIQTLEADCRRPPFDDSSFDAIVDKGTLDVFVNTDRREAVSLVQEAARLLKPGGVTTDPPEVREDLFLGDSWTITSRCVTGDLDVVQYPPYLYVATLQMKR